MTRIVRVAGPAALLLGAAIALAAALAIGGAANPGLLDPGAIVRYGFPIAKLVMDLGVATAIGALLLALFALTPGRPEFERAVDVAAAGAGVWTVAGAASAVFFFSTATSNALSLDPAYGTALGDYLTGYDGGRVWLMTVLAGAIVTVLCFAVRHPGALLAVAVLAVAAQYPVATQGHAGDTASHDAATTAVYLHVVFASIWLGGLLTLILLRGRMRRGADADARLLEILPRYSTIALICFVVVAVSGYISAAIRVGTLAALATPYGVLILLKVGSLLVLGLFGAMQRRVVIARLRAGGRPRWFWGMVAAELAFMGIAAGVAAALARSAPPVAAVAVGTAQNATPAEVLTSQPLPPELTPIGWVTQWSPDLFWSLICAFAVFFYLAGVRRLRRRGDRWPVHRTVLWIAGIAGLFWVTNGAVNVYERYLFSVHMLGHMLLTMAIPLLLVLSAPVTLALRAVHKREDGSRGVREWLLRAVQSRVSRVLTHPLVAAILFAGSLWVFYYSPLLRWSAQDHLGHVWMVTHFLITGYLFCSVLVGIDPIGNQPPYPLRLVLLLATMAMHAFFGLSILTGTGMFLPDWYGAMGRTWGPSPLVDQQNAGGIAWSVGELPTVALAIVVAILWSRSDTREATRRDRAADRDGDTELDAYNAMLAQRQRSGDRVP